MNREKIVKTLEEQEEVLFTYKNHYIYIQERIEGGFESDIYESEQSFDNGENAIDGGICDSILATVAIEFFIEMVNELINKRD